MSSSTRTGRRISLLPELRMLLVLVALCVLEACSMWQQLHGRARPVAGAPAAPEERGAAPVDSPATGAADSAAAALSAAGSDPAPADGTAAIEPRENPPVGRSIRHTQPGGSRDGLASGDVGYYMDVLQGQLTQAIGRDAHIERRGRIIVLLLPLGFDVDSAQLNPDGRQAVRRVAEILSEYRLTVVSVQVSGPASAAYEAGSRLSGDRLEALSKYLTRAGVAGKRISTAGEGSNLSPEGSAAAALPGVRAELQVSPIMVGAGN